MLGKGLQALAQAIARAATLAAGEGFATLAQGSIGLPGLA